MTHSAIFASLLSLCLLAGCGGHPGSAPPTGAQTAAPPTGAVPTAAGAGPAAAGSGSVPGTPAALAAKQVDLKNYAAALAMVRPDHFAIFKIDVPAVLNSKLIRSLPFTRDEVLQHLAHGGPDVEVLAGTLPKLELLCFSIGPLHEALGRGAPPFAFGAYARFTKPEDLQHFVDGFRGQSVPATYNGRSYNKPKEAGRGVVYLEAGRELYMSTDDATIHQMIDAKGALPDVPLLKKLAGVNFDAPIVAVGSLGPFKDMAVAAARQVAKGSPMEGTARLTDQFDSAAIAIDLDGEKLIDIQVDMQTDQSAEKLKSDTKEFIAGFKERMDQEGAGAAKGSAKADSLDLTKALIGAIAVEQAGKRVRLTLPHTKELAQLPETLRRVMNEARATATRMQKEVNARTIMFAIANWQISFGTHPQNVADPAGKPLLSWRVMILPFVEQDMIFRQIQRNEPWNSEHNRQFQSRMPALLKTDSATEPNTTTWRLMPENPANIFLIDAGKGAAVPWMEPDELKLDPNNPLAALGVPPADGFVIAYKNGRVVKMLPEELKAALTGKAKSEEPVKKPAAAPPRGAAIVEERGEPYVAPKRDDASKPRTWHDAAGTRSVEAVLVDVKGGSVTLRRTDSGMVVSLPIDKLSEADRQYLKAANGKNPKETGTEAAPIRLTAENAPVGGEAEMAFEKKHAGQWVEITLPVNLMAVARYHGKLAPMVQLQRIATNAAGERDMQRLDCIFSRERPWQRFDQGDEPTILGKLNSGPNLANSLEDCTIVASKGKPVKSVTAAELLRALKKSPAAFAKEYQQQWGCLIVSGEVAEVDKEKGLVLLKGDGADTVTCDARGPGNLAPDDKEPKVGDHLVVISNILATPRPPQSLVSPRPPQTSPILLGMCSRIDVLSASK